MRAFNLLAWLVAIAAMGAAGYFYFESEKLREEIAAAGPASPTPVATPAPNETAALREQIAALEAELADARAGNAETEPTEADASETSPNIDPAALLQGMLARTEGSEEADGESGMFGAMDKMFQGEQGERMMQTVAKSQVTMMYGDFIRNLAIDEAGKQAVRDILTEHFASAARRGMQAVQERDLEDMKEEQEDFDAALRDELSEVLTPAELEQFDAYQETVGARTLANSLEMQMQFMAPDLDAESRTLLSDIAYEEALATPELASADSMAGGSPGEALQQQADLFDRMIERAGQVMEPGQFAAAEAFLRQQQEMMQSFAGVFMEEEAAPDE